MHSLEEVQEHFKNAEKVRCLSDGIIYDFKPDEIGIYRLYDVIWFKTLDDIDVALSYHNQLAEIVSYKSDSKKYKYVGECNGNDGNGCFMDSCGHDCGCFKKVEVDANIGKWFITKDKAGILKWNSGSYTSGFFEGKWGTNWVFSYLDGATLITDNEVINMFIKYK